MNEQGPVPTEELVRRALKLGTLLTVSLVTNMSIQRLTQDEKVREAAAQGTQSASAISAMLINHLMLLTGRPALELLGEMGLAPEAIGPKQREHYASLEERLYDRFSDVDEARRQAREALERILPTTIVDVDAHIRINFAGAP